MLENIHTCAITEYANKQYVPSVSLAVVTRSLVVACDRASSFRYSDLNAGAIFELEATGVELAPFLQPASGASKRRGCAADGLLDVAIVKKVTIVKNVAAHNSDEEPERNCNLEFHSGLKEENINRYNYQNKEWFLDCEEFMGGNEVERIVRIAPKADCRGRRNGQTVKCFEHIPLMIKVVIAVVCMVRRVLEVLLILHGKSHTAPIRVASNVKTNA
jgi:hypothetical protein